MTVDHLLTGESERRLLESRRQQALLDIAELTEQVEAGEIPAEAAQELRQVYLAEQRQVDEELRRLGPAPEEPEPPLRASSRRSWPWWGALAVALLALVTFGGESVFSEGDDGGSTAGPTAASMEELVASRPDDNALRLILADLYFEAGDLGRALDHYIAIASHDPTADEESRALARIGWLANLSGDAPVAVDYLTASLDIDPDFSEGKLYLGLVYLYGLDDAALAMPLLEEASTISGLPADVAAMVEGAVADASAALTEEGT